MLCYVEIHARRRRKKKGEAYFGLLFGEGLTRKKTEKRHRIGCPRDLYRLAKELTMRVDTSRDKVVKGEGGKERSSGFPSHKFQEDREERGQRTDQSLMKGQ